MSRLYFATSNAASLELVEELSVVRLTGLVETADGVLPAGASGTVVAVCGAGEACLVEFIEPFHALETLGFDAIEPVPGLSRADILADLRAADR